jgi:hypothetical protein
MISRPRPVGSPQLCTLPTGLTPSARYKVVWRAPARGAMIESRHVTLSRNRLSSTPQTSPPLSLVRSTTRCSTSISMCRRGAYGTPRESLPRTTTPRPPSRTTQMRLTTQSVLTGGSPEPSERSNPSGGASTAVRQSVPAAGLALGEIDVELVVHCREVIGRHTHVGRTRLPNRRGVPPALPGGIHSLTSAAVLHFASPGKASRRGDRMDEYQSLSARRFVIRI